MTLFFITKSCLSYDYLRLQTCLALTLLTRAGGRDSAGPGLMDIGFKVKSSDFPEHMENLPGTSTHVLLLFGTVQLKPVVLDSLLITVRPFSVSSVAFCIIISRVTLTTLLVSSGCSSVLHGYLTHRDTTKKSDFKREIYMMKRKKKWQGRYCRTAYFKES